MLFFLAALVFGLVARSHGAALERRGADPIEGGLLTSLFNLDGTSSVYVPGSPWTEMTAYWSTSSIKSYVSADHRYDTQAITTYRGIGGTFCAKIEAGTAYLRFAPLGGSRLDGVDLRAKLQSVDLFPGEVADCAKATPTGWFGRDLGRNLDDEQGWTYTNAPTVIGIGANLGDKECRWSNDGCLTFSTAGVRTVRFVFKM